MVKKTIPHPDKTIFTSGEACGYLGICWNTMKSLINDGEIRAVRIGKKYLIPKESIDNFINKEALITKMIARGINN
jgi:excisionase family DNA binding protein